MWGVCVVRVVESEGVCWEGGGEKGVCWEDSRKEREEHGASVLYTGSDE